MRLRVHKRKVVALLLGLGAAACALALWGGGGGGESAAAAAEEAGDAAGAAAAATSMVLSARPSSGGGGNASGSAAWWANETAALRSLVFRANFDQAARQGELWTAGPPLGPGEAALALVVQVHERPEHLRLLLASLRRAPGAGKVLLVLSHDVWSAELNALAAAVDFCAVLQVFFPFSRQLYPAEFPGSDPRDCPRDLGRAAALRRGCLNARYPDAFGHYREAAFAQTKHHWWWKLHFVWERVRILRQRPPALVLFLEEDHYLAPDFYAALQALWALRQRECPDCQVLSLGSYAAVRGGFGARADKAELKTWKSTEHNMGMAFARETYEQLLACADAFCTYDDYNWDWTLQHLTAHCLPRFWKVLVPEIPRVFHTGDCGMHHRQQACRPAAQAAKVDALLDANRQHLFPAAMSLSKRHALAPISPHVKNGGWGDIRDHELCKSYRRLQ
ncbi:alpha-1,6-mannosyl-glycoprotein 2-beta-N-acetylglucosaminyltransferase [Heteronotia binoei]|uniref:alpha-1,6-mannosyl-glycoprotein 2-beta-N-acetylglucosaminyltransferase n=1 Tax=Heteronotia binoei TaxID=13085 RepID=UPI0029313DBF|nr:alpha-1,6-mannosyl-glycoprotein 2-beta-N-acetylglucosaminyltransferase [Heteronotia binoei]